MRNTLLSTLIAASLLVWGAGCSKKAADTSQTANGQPSATQTTPALQHHQQPPRRPGHIKTLRSTTTTSRHHLLPVRRTPAPSAHRSPANQPPRRRRRRRRHPDDDAAAATSTPPPVTTTSPQPAAGPPARRHHRNIVAASRSSSAPPQRLGTPVRPTRQPPQRPGATTVVCPCSWLSFLLLRLQVPPAHAPSPLAPSARQPRTRRGGRDHRRGPRGERLPRTWRGRRASAAGPDRCALVASARGRAPWLRRPARTRPTADRVRQALFDRLLHAPWGRADDGRGCRCWTCQGAGALGLEALSRRGRPRHVHRERPSGAGRAFSQAMAMLLSAPTGWSC